MILHKDDRFVLESSIVRKKSNSGGGDNSPPNLNVESPTYAKSIYFSENHKWWRADDKNVIINT